MNVRERDIELTNKVLNGDAESFTILIGDVRPVIRGRAFKALGCIDAAEDVAQQTIINAYTKIDKYRGESAFSSWVYTIATNCIRMHLRSRRRIEKHEDKVDDPNKNTMVCTTTPLDNVQLIEICEIVDDAMEALSGPYREIVDLWIMGLSLKEVAEYTLLSFTAAKSRLHRARKYMKNYILEKYGKRAANEIF